MAFWKRQTITVNTTAAGCDPIDLREWEGVRVIPGSGITSLTWVESPTIDGTYATANGTSASTPIVQSGLTAGQSYLMPTELNAAHFAKTVANAAGTITLVLKKSS